MPRKIRLLTDSPVKHDLAVQRMDEIILKEDLKKARKEHQKKRLLRSDSTKVEVVKTFLALGGNLQLTAGSCGIPHRTLQNWKATDWWKNLVSELKKADKLELSAKTKTIVERSMELLLDRIENGDAFFNQKTGEVQRKPVSAAALNQIAKDMMDRKLILDKAFEETIPETTKGDKLAALAERFAKLAEATLENKKPTIEVTDVVFAEEKRNA